MSKINYQATLLDPRSLEPIEVNPKNGKSFKLAELYTLLDCDTIEVIPLDGTLILIVDEEGKFKKAPVLNMAASQMWYKCFPQMRGQDVIVGKALLCHTRQLH